MNTFLCQLKRELKAIFYGWLAYVVLALFWLLSGLNYYWLLLQLADGERLTFAQQLLFSGPILVFTLPVLVPLLTMKLFAEERKLGTFEILLSAPISIPCLVVSKFTAAFIFYLLLWVPHLIFVLGLNSLLMDQSSYFIQSGVVGTGLFGLMLVGGLYCAIGLMSLESSPLATKVRLKSTLQPASPKALKRHSPSSASNGPSTNETPIDSLSNPILRVTSSKVAPALLATTLASTHSKPWASWLQLRTVTLSQAGKNSG